jgi:hypothetical protein
MTLTRRTFIAAAASTAVAPVEALAPAVAAPAAAVFAGDHWGTAYFDLWSRAELERLGQWPQQALNERYWRMLNNITEEE